MNSKNAYVIDFYDRFECIGGSCPYTCCKGWQIAVDDETYKQYKEQKFPKNLLYSLMTGKVDNIRSIRKINSTCPYYTQEGLCGFQKNDTEKLMPKVCRQYPRTSIGFGDYNEVTLELSCIRAAELFVENIGRHEFLKSEDCIEENWTIGNDSKSFLEFLQNDRAKILSYIWEKDKEISFSERLQNLYEYIYVENQYLSRDNLVGAKKLTIPLSQAEKEDISIPRISLKKGQIPFYPIWFMNEIIYEKLSGTKVKKNNRYLYNLVRCYKQIFGELSEAEADDFFREHMDKLIEEQPELEIFFVSYFSYLIQQMYCKAYEDYYVLGQILLALMDLQFMMLFILVHNMENGHLEPADIAAVLANTERAIRHNLVLNEDMLYKIRNTYFK